MGGRNSSFTMLELQFDPVTRPSSVVAFVVEGECALLCVLVSQMC
jgi:hypothetical protein